MENKISDRLRFVMQETDSPKLLEICSKIAFLDIKVQDVLLDCIEQKIPLELIMEELNKKRIGVGK